GCAMARERTPMFLNASLLSGRSGLRGTGWLVVALALGACLRTLSPDCPGGAVCPVGLRCTATGSMPICALPTCGDGHLDRGEACDDGNNVSGDGCPADCRPPCGDGYLDPGEACDDGNTVGGDGCSADCRSLEACTGSDGPTCS